MNIFFFNFGRGLKRCLEPKSVYRHKGQNISLENQ